MLKSLKHDFISTGRIMGVIYAIMAGLSLFIVLTKDVKEGAVSLLGVLALMILSLCLLVLTAVVVMLDFQRSLYGDRGYLTFTLPVKSWQILASKIIVSGAWFVIALCAIIGSMWVALSSAKEYFGEDYEMMKDTIEMLFGANIDSMVAMIVVRIIILFVEFCFFAIVIFLTNTLSNTRHFQKHSIFFTIIFFVPIFAAIYYITMKANELFVFSLFFIDGKPEFVADAEVYKNYISQYYSPVDISEVIIYVLMGIVCFWITHWLMSKKVNIK